MRMIFLVGVVAFTPAVASAQAIAWRLVSTTGGLVLAPAHPAAGNEAYFDRQRQRLTVRVSASAAAVRPFALARRTVAAGASAP